jgi:hypothetical protein
MTPVRWAVATTTCVQSPSTNFVCATRGINKGRLAGPRSMNDRRRLCCFVPSKVSRWSPPKCYRRAASTIASHFQPRPVGKAEPCTSYTSVELIKRYPPPTKYDLHGCGDGGCLGVEMERHH